MDEFVARTSRWRMAVLVAGSLGFVAAGLWMAGLLGSVPVSRRNGPLTTQIWGWIGTLFFGLCAVSGAKLWWADAERLRINKWGIGWSGKTITWDEIAEVKEWQNKGTKLILLQLRDPSRFRGTGFAGLLSRADSALTGGDVGITLAGTDRKFDEAMSAIAMFRPDR